MKVAITGARGYIGHYVINELKKDQQLELILLSHSDGNAPYTFVDYSEEGLKREFQGVDAVIHLAAKKTIRSYSEMERNIALMNVIADAAADSGVNKIIYASSISVYGKEETLPWTEDMAESPRTLYGLSKLSAEHILRLKANQGQMYYTCLRFAHVIGESMPGGYMIPTFFRNVIKKLPLMVNGRSIAKRELIDVLDVARSVYWALLNEDTNNQIVNIGTGMGLTNLEIAKVMQKISGVDIRYDDSKSEGIVSSVMCVEKARRLGFSALRTPEEAICRIIGEQ